MITPDELTGAMVKAIRTKHKITREAFKDRCVEAGLDWGKSVARLCNIEGKDSWKAGDKEVVAAIVNQLEGDSGIDWSSQLDVPHESGPTGVDDQSKVDQKSEASGQSNVDSQGSTTAHSTTSEKPDPFAASKRFMANVQQYATPVPVWCDEDQADGDDDEMTESFINVVTEEPAAPFRHANGEPCFGCQICLGDALDVSDVDDPDDGAVTVDPTDMTAFETDYSDREITITNSQVQAAKRCKRKWWLAWYRGLAPRYPDLLDVRSTGLRIHRALQAWYVPDGKTPTDPRDALERALTEDWTALLTAARERGHDEFVLGNLAEKFDKAASLERAMVEGYVEWLQETGADANLKVIASETPVRVHLYDHVRTDGEVQAVHAMGLLDVRAYRTSDGARLFLDHKSVGNFKQPVALLPMNEQMLHYHLLEWLSSIDGEEHCDGALYNMIRRVKRTAAAKPPFYDRYEVRHNIHELENYRRRLIAETRDILRMTEALDAGADPLDVAYPTPTSNCSWDCDFFAICSMFDDGSRAEDAVTGLFEIVDPNARYEGKGTE